MLRTSLFGCHGSVTCHVPACTASGVTALEVEVAAIEEHIWPTCLANPMTHCVPGWLLLIGPPRPDTPYYVRTGVFQAAEP